MYRKRLLRRLISFILATVLCISGLPLTPLTAMAAELDENEVIMEEPTEELSSVTEKESEVTESFETTEYMKDAEVSSESTEVSPENSEESTDENAEDTSEEIPEESIPSELSDFVDQVTELDYRAIYSTNCLTEVGKKIHLADNNATVSVDITPVWNESKLSFAVTVNDMTLGEDDKIIIYVDAKNCKGSCTPIKKELLRADAETAYGKYSGILDFPISKLTPYKVVGFCISVVDCDSEGNTTQVQYGGKEDTCDKNSQEYYELALMPCFESIVLEDPHTKYELIPSNMGGCNYGLSVDSDDAIQLAVSVQPKSGKYSVAWESSCLEVAAVDNNGTVNVFQSNSTSIKATIQYPNGKTDSKSVFLEVKVDATSAEIQGIPDEVIMKPSSRGTYNEMVLPLTEKVYPTIATENSVTKIKSSDTNIIQIRDENRNTPEAIVKKEGKVTLTISVYDKEDYKGSPDDLSPLFKVDREIVVKKYNVSISEIVGEEYKMQQEVLGDAFTSLKEVKLPEEVTEAGYFWKYPDTKMKPLLGTFQRCPITYVGEENPYIEYADDSIDVAIYKLDSINLQSKINCIADGSNVDITALLQCKMYGQTETFNPVITNPPIQGWEKFSFTLSETSKLYHRITESESEGKWIVNRKEDTKEGMAAFKCIAKLNTATPITKTAKITLPSRKIAKDNFYVYDSRITHMDSGENYVFTIYGRYDIAYMSVTSDNEEIVKVLTQPRITNTFDHGMCNADFEVKAGYAGMATLTIKYEKNPALNQKYRVTVSNGTFYITAIDKDTMDKNLSDSKLAFNITERDNVVSYVTATVTKDTQDYSQSFQVKCECNSEYAAGNVKVVYLSIKDDAVAAALPTGKYSVVITVHYKDDRDNEFTQEFLAINMTIVATEPTFKVKQTKKVNLFYAVAQDKTLNTTGYSDKYGAQAGDGVLTITSSVSDFTCKVLDELKEDFDVEKTDGAYRVFVKSNKTKANDLDKIVTLSFSYEGYRSYVTTTQDVKVGVEDKEPKLVLEANTTVLHSLYQDDGIRFIVRNTSTDEIVEPIKEKDEVINVTLSGKNADKYRLDDSNKGAFYLHDDYGKSDTVVLNVQNANWRKAIALKLKITVNDGLPKMTTNQKSVTLNTKYAGQEKGVFTFNAKGMDDATLKRVAFSVNKNRESFSFNVEEIDGKNAFTVELLDPNLAPGTYKLSITPVMEKGLATNEEILLKLNTVNVTIKVISKNASVSVSQKGKIDVLRRNTTSIDFTPKLSNITGKIVDCTVTGESGFLFNAQFVDGVTKVKALENSGLSVKTKYAVTLVYSVTMADRSVVKLSVPKKIGVMQGKVNIKRLNNEPIELAITGEISYMYLKTTIGDEIVKVYNSVGEDDSGKLSYNVDNVFEGIRIGLINNDHEVVVGNTYTYKVNVYFFGQATDTKLQTITVKAKIVD